MHWIVDGAQFGEPGHEALISELRLQQQPFTIVRIAPMADYLVATADDLDEDGHNRPLVLKPEGSVFAIGATVLAGISKASGWSPGFIEAPSQTACMQAWGTHMLNHGSAIGLLSDIEPEHEEFFIRPVEDLKSFPGTVLARNGYSTWRREITSSTGIAKVPPDTEVVVAPLRRIDAEYRCVAVRGRIVAQSRYRLGGRLSISPQVEPDVTAYVEDRLAEWNPTIAVTVDVGRTPEGLRIIETNAVSSSGFYAMDMAAFVRGLSSI